MGLATFTMVNLSNFTLKLVKHIVNLDVVATPLRAKCEGEAHTPKSGKLEFSGSLKNLELDCKGQTPLH